MKYDLNFKIIAEPSDVENVQQIGGEDTNSNLVLRSSKNEEILYIDGACDGSAPLYLGIIKSRGNQKNKLPIHSNDFLGGLQIYGRIKEGQSLGYCPEETPLLAGIQFKVSDNTSQVISTEMLIGLSDQDGMSVKLILDQHGNLRTIGNITLGDLTITDQEVSSNLKIEKFIKVIYKEKEYAIPMYSIL